MIRRKKNGALRFDENIENSDEQEIYCVKINPKLWYRKLEGIPSYTTNYDEVDFFTHEFEAEAIARRCGGKVVRCVTVIFYESIKINHALSDNEHYIIRLNENSWYRGLMSNDNAIDSYTQDIFKATPLQDFDEARRITKQLSGRLYRRLQYYYEDEYL